MIKSDKGRTKITGSTAEILVDLEYIGETFREVAKEVPKAIILDSFITGLYGDNDGKETEENKAKTMLMKCKGEPGFDELIKEITKEE